MLASASKSELGTVIVMVVGQDGCMGTPGTGLVNGDAILLAAEFALGHVA